MKRLTLHKNVKISSLDMSCRHGDEETGAGPVLIIPESIQAALDQQQVSQMAKTVGSEENSPKLCLFYCALVTVGFFL